MKRKITTSILLILMSATVFAQYDDATSTLKPDTTNNNKDPMIQVFNEDIIVHNSIGVGLDVPNDYAFGFTTIALIENNLRILFDDSSVGGFPANDWQLTANSPDNGGDNYFRIDDVTAGTSPFTVQSGAGSNALFIKRTNGYVGFGTADPVRDLHVLSGDTPGLRLQQDMSGGYPAQTWDVYGNEVNFNLADGNTGAYCFRIQPGTPTNTLTLRSGGLVGIGTWTPEHTLEVKGDVQVDSYFYFGDESTDGNWRVSVVAGKLTFEKREGGVWMSKIEME
ncbi:MAG: hypothetical protein R2750_09660 [Bacteroidales bacterium]